ncbi:Acetyltransferase (GNAT) domain protein [anaerobic digester metagenome]
MKIRILTEGSEEIGFGHVTRCMSIYQAFQERGLDTELVVNGNKSIEKLMEGTNHRIINWLKRDELISVIHDSDITVVDSYLAPPELYEIISGESLGVYIDDNNRISYPEGMVVNGSVNAEKLQYPEKKGLYYLLGSRYIPLRREFWNIKPLKIKSNLQSIMITFGGDDVRNMTPIILETLENEFPELKKNVVIGRGFKNLDEIEKLKSDNVNLVYYPDADGMIGTMLQSDLAVSAGGQTLYELARLGLPTLSVAVASNQLHNVKNWEQTGFSNYMGLWTDENLPEKIVENLRDLNHHGIRNQMSETGKRAVDGRGALRIVKKSLLEYYLRKGLNLRKAELRDMENVHHLSNDPEVRKNSFRTELIPFQDHEKWFKNKLNDEKSLFIMSEVENEFAAQIRFEIEEEVAIISISISEKYRGIGIGYPIINEALKLLKDSSNVKLLKAYIKKSNNSSLKFFEKSGFKLTGPVLIDGNEAYEYEYILRD